MKNYADFMILLSPSDSVKAQVKQHKLDAAMMIGDYESMHSIAHISIRKMPRQKSFLTEPVLLGLNPKLGTVPPVTLAIDGFDYFNHGDAYKTLYAKIRNTPATTLWFKQLKRHLNIKDFMVPHITIARNIPVAEFDILWPHFKAIKWNEFFTVPELTVLQRETFAPFATWQKFTTLPFNGKEQYAPAPPKPTLLKSMNSQQTSLF